jgi:hypothetical protein
MPGLRVLAGPTAEDLVPVTDIINTGRAFSIRSERFEGQVAIYVKNFVDPKGRQLTSEYFEREDRKGITWSIQVQGTFFSLSYCIVSSDASAQAGSCNHIQRMIFCLVMSSRSA